MNTCIYCGDNLQDYENKICESCLEKGEVEDKENDIYAENGFENEKHFWTWKLG